MHSLRTGPACLVFLREARGAPSVLRTLSTLVARAFLRVVLCGGDVCCAELMSWLLARKARELALGAPAEVGCGVRRLEERNPRASTTMISDLSHLGPG
ncbi:hypothetical protein IWZ03DRAFT_167945 [Phyllosticta citriasiana]|uniref:Uncharacterized protein n=1 Tax=Phyllosticta citriasiana TaxID=595635 RepID=A0ABR1KS50_9PEZI